MAISLTQQQHPTLDALRASPLPPLSRARSFDTSRSLLNPDLTRPYSPSAHSSDAFLTPQRNNSLQLPGLAAFASMASAHHLSRGLGSGVMGESTRRTTTTKNSDDDRTPPPPPFLFTGAANNIANMSYATAAPGQPAGSSPPICQNCSTGTTPLWRRDDSGSVLCNACGLFLKLHGRPRPISLKTDVIKSRNRVKAPATPNGQQGQPNGKHRKSSGQAHGLAAAHPDLAHGHMHSDAPLPTNSRSGTPSYHLPHPPNIAPQHMFDSSTGVADALQQPYPTHSPSFHIHSLTIPARNGSPSASSLLNGQPADAAALADANERLKTRVSELEVINELFRGRVGELEASEGEARRLVDELRGHVEALQRNAKWEGEGEEGEEEDGEGRRRSKRMRMSDVVVGGGGNGPEEVGERPNGIGVPADESEAGNV